MVNWSWLKEMVRRFTNRTSQWRQDPSVDLKLDLQGPRLAERCFLDQPLATLSFLGRGEHRAASWEYVFRQHGLTLRYDDHERIVELMVFFGHADEPKQGQATFPVVYHGKQIQLAGATQGEIHAALGEPYWYDQDSDEILLFYEFRNVEYQLEFGRDGRLKCLVVGRPMLADALQRSHYGVTKPWPPPEQRDS